jgi:hypothetical protein
LILCLGSTAVDAQKRIAGFIETMPTAKLKQLFPGAAGFTPRGERDPL